MNHHGLYIVVRHPRAPRSQYENVWLDDLRLASITTQPWLAELLETRRHRNATAFVHRGVLPGKSRPTIACEVRVATVTWPDDGLPTVQFDVVRTIDVRAAHRPQPREICYSGVLDPLASPARGL